MVTIGISSTDSKSSYTAWNNLQSSGIIDTYSSRCQSDRSLFVKAILLRKTWLSNLPLYKITKIVRVLWLAERSVCTRVCKHGCDVRWFAIRELITHARIWSLLYLLIPSSAETWKIFSNKLCQLFFRASWHFKREKSVFWKASFCKTRTNYACDW